VHLRLEKLCVHIKGFPPIPFGKLSPSMSLRLMNDLHYIME
jgi:hypothetical protein